MKIDIIKRDMMSRFHNQTDTCDKIKKFGFSWRRCGEDFTKSGHGRPYAEKDDKGKSTGRWICHKCYMKDCHKRPDDNHNIIKSMRHRRIGDLDQDCSSAKGDLFEKLTSIWRGVKILSIEEDNYRLPLDHSEDPELGIIETRGKLYDSYNKFWAFAGLERVWNKEFDKMICYCVSKDMKYIEYICIFPKHEIIGITCITIYRNPVRAVWYEKYIIKDKGILNKVNEIWKEILAERNIL